MTLFICHSLALLLVASVVGQFPVLIQVPAMGQDGIGEELEQEGPCTGWSLSVSTGEGTN